MQWTMDITDVIGRSPKVCYNEDLLLYVVSVVNCIVLLKYYVEFLESLLCIICYSEIIRQWALSF